MSGLSTIAAEDLPPQAKHGLYKTELCKNFMTVGFCAYGPKCQFAHGEAELRRASRHPKFKTQRCKNWWTTGVCAYGNRCHFLHAEPGTTGPGGSGGGAYSLDDLRDTGISPVDPSAASTAHTFYGHSQMHAHAPAHARDSSYTLDDDASGQRGDGSGFRAIGPARESMRSYGSASTATSDRDHGVSGRTLLSHPSAYGAQAFDAGNAGREGAPSSGRTILTHVSGFGAPAEPPSPPGLRGDVFASFGHDHVHAGARGVNAGPSLPSPSVARGGPAPFAGLPTSPRTSAGPHHTFGHVPSAPPGLPAPGMMQSKAPVQASAMAPPPIMGLQGPRPRSGSFDPLGNTNSMSHMHTMPVGDSREPSTRSMMSGFTFESDRSAISTYAHQAHASSSQLGWAMARQARGSAIAAGYPQSHSFAGQHAPMPSQPHRSATSYGAQPAGDFASASVRSVGSMDSANASMLQMAAGGPALFSSSRSMDFGGSFEIFGGDMSDAASHAFVEESLSPEEAAARAALSVAAAAIDDDDASAVASLHQRQNRGGSESDRSLVLSMLGSDPGDVWAEPASSRQTPASRQARQHPAYLPQGISERQLLAARPRTTSTQAPLHAHAAIPAQVHVQIDRGADVRHSFVPQAPGRLAPGTSSHAGGRRTSIRQTLTQERGADATFAGGLVPAHAGMAPTRPVAASSTTELPGGGIMQIQYTYHPPPNSTATVAMLPGVGPTDAPHYSSGVDDLVGSGNTIMLPTPDGRGLMPVEVDSGPVFKAYSRHAAPGGGRQPATTAKTTPATATQTRGLAMQPPLPSQPAPQPMAARGNWFSFGAPTNQGSPAGQHAPGSLPPHAGCAAPSVRIVVVHHTAPPQPSRSPLQSLLSSVSAGFSSAAPSTRTPPAQSKLATSQQPPRHIPVPASLARGPPSEHAHGGSSPLAPSPETPRTPRARMSAVLPPASVPPTPTNSPTHGLEPVAGGETVLPSLHATGGAIKLLNTAAHSSSSSVGGFGGGSSRSAGSRLLEPVLETPTEEDAHGSSDDDLIYAGRTPSEVRAAVTGIDSSAEASDSDVEMIRRRVVQRLIARTPSRTRSRLADVLHRSGAVLPISTL